MSLSPKRVARRMLGAAVAVSLAGTPAAFGQWIPPVGSLSSRLSADDFDRMSAAAARLYQDRSIGTVERWRNPDTRNAGSVKLLRRFEAEGMPCWRMEYLIRLAETKEPPHRYRVNWCKTASGEWKMLEYTPRD